jgi:hypothetical protein
VAPPRKNNVESIGDRAAASARAVKAEDLVEQIRKLAGDSAIEIIYRERVLTQRTRSYSLHAPARQTGVEILHTLLGVELKIGNRRLLCPDLATARYLAVFARAGCDSVAIPYDITQVSRLADELESAWHRTMLLVDHLSSGRSARLQRTVKHRILQHIREEIARLGAGARYPQFDQITRRTRVTKTPGR